MLLAFGMEVLLEFSFCGLQPIKIILWDSSCLGFPATAMIRLLRWTKESGCTCFLFVHLLMKESIRRGRMKLSMEIMAHFMVDDSNGRRVVYVENLLTLFLVQVEEEKKKWWMLLYLNSID